jgi:uncharacterized protein
VQWRGRRESGNVEDRRGIGPRHIAIGGGGITVIIIAVIVALLGGNPNAVLQQGQSAATVTTAASTGTTQEDELTAFAKTVLASTEDVWTQQFKAMGRSYRLPTLVIYSGTADMPGGGIASAATGPFYYPTDEKVYLDLSFFQELADRFQAPGDFADAYVIAHEVGHHVQKLLGIMDQVDTAQQGASEAEADALSVRLELQADFLAGVWAHYAKTSLALDAADIEEALTAAAAIGDDRLQKETQGYVVPDTFTHGTSAQRVRWFKLGYDTGDISQGDTFSANPL